MASSLASVQLPCASKKTKIQNPIIRNINFKKRRTSRKHGVLTGKSLKISHKKRAKTIFSIFQKTQWNTRTLKTSKEHGSPKHQDLN